MTLITTSFTAVTFPSTALPQLGSNICSPTFPLETAPIPHHKKISRALKSGCFTGELSGSSNPGSDLLKSCPNQGRHLCVC